MIWNIDRRKGFWAAHRKWGPGLRVLFYLAVIAILLAVGFGSCQLMKGATKEGQKETHGKLEEIDSKLHNQGISHVSIIPVGWRRTHTVAGDSGIKARFIIDNYGDSSVKDAHLLDEYYIIAHILTDDLPNIQQLLTTQSDTFDAKKNEAIVTYEERKRNLYKKIASFFRKQFIPNVSPADLEKKLISDGIDAQVLGSVDEYFFAPRILTPKEKHTYEYGRSVGAYELEKDILDEGIKILIIASVLDYTTKDDKLFRSFLICRSDYGRNNTVMFQGVLYYKLLKHEEWFNPVGAEE